MLVILLALVVDQTVKLLVKTQMDLHDSIRVTNWFYILFIENNGMAFGWELFGKVFLTLFRLVASGLLVWYIVWLCRRPKEEYRMGYIVCISLILAGALGNVIDCLFYGLLFDYAPFMQGRVVDMLYFPLIDTVLPAGFPIWGGEHFVFFRPVFNIADSCITVGIFVLIIFYHRELVAADHKSKTPAK